MMRISTVVVAGVLAGYDRPRDLGEVDQRVRAMLDAPEDAVTTFVAVNSAHPHADAEGRTFEVHYRFPAR
jgi:hypothetical protein